jgi:hypothetical protein
MTSTPRASSGSQRDAEEEIEIEPEVCFVEAAIQTDPLAETKVEALQARIASLQEQFQLFKASCKEEMEAQIAECFVLARNRYKEITLRESGRMCTSDWLGRNITVYRMVRFPLIFAEK